MRHNHIMKFIISLIMAFFLLTNAASADELVTVARAGNAAVVRLSSGRFSGPQIWTLVPFQPRVLMRVDEEKTSSKPALSRDGKWVAWGCKDGTLRVFSAHNGSLRARPGHSQMAKKDDYSDPYQVRALAFSPSGKTLAWANYKGLFLLDWRRHKLIYSRPLPTPYYHSLQEPVVLSFSGDGRYVAVAGQDKTGSDDQEDAHIFLLDSAGSLRRYWRMDCGDGEPMALKFSPDAKSLLVVSDLHVSMSSYDKIDLFSLHSEEPLWHHDNIDFYPYSDDPNTGTSGDTDRYPSFAEFSRDGTRVAIGSNGTRYGDSNFLEIRRASDGKVLSLINKPEGVLPLADQRKLRPELTFH